MSYQIVDCRDLGPERLTSAMNAAFSDYVVPLSMTVEAFMDFQKQRGFSSRHSFVVLQGEEIVAFWFSSVPNPAYGNRAYTLSVGTCPELRRKGLSRQLFETVVRAQKRDAANGLQLEVVSTNAKAVKAYESFGFSRKRKLRVCKLKTDGLLPLKPVHLQLATLSVGEIPENEAEFFDTAPTPQNSRAALAGLAETSHIVGARRRGELVGWGAAFKDGAVAQIAVRKDQRRSGIGRTMLHQLAEQTGAEQLTFVNIDESAVGINAFLNKEGAEEILQQFEMRFVF
ncbi:MAG: GNAT family N-acetyltransferase [Pseudomonadota bacterium]